MIEKLILGTVQLGLPYGINNKSGQPSPFEARKILDKAFEYGIRYLDTAEAYGSSQQVIGDYHRHSVQSGQFRVITKYAAKENHLTPDQLYVSFLDNLAMLGVDSIESYLFHSFDSYKSFKHWDVLQKLIAESRLGNVGVSVYTNSQADATANDPGVKVVQLPFNLLDNISQRETVLKKLKQSGKEVHVRSVFLQGLFFKDRNALGKLEPLKTSLETLDNLASENKLEIGTMALAYNLRQPLIDKVLIGVETEKQLDDNIAAIKNAGLMNPELLGEIDEIKVAASELLNPVNW